ncbi:MAG TPA: STAS domain-containing protein [Mycobacteriales bacterium]|nr:STAS domain-containing protein [Mycobacteriales bacterium]
MHPPADAIPAVEVSALADGLVIRLSGHLGHGDTDALRAALLTPRPRGCDDVLVDAGDVAAVDDDALAVLLAAPAFAAQTGGRLTLTRSSAALSGTLDAIGLADALPVLGPVGLR